MMGNIPLCAPQEAWLMSHVAGAQHSGAVLLRRMALQPGGGTLLGSISDFCRRTGMAESTFGRRAVNDGKFVARLRDGARVTPETLTRVNNFMVKHGAPGAGDAPPELMPLIHGGATQRAPAPAQKADPETNFRFFDNRQKYLLFVNTCSEKDVIARRVGLELGQIHPRPPRAVEHATSMVWHEAALTGTTSHDFSEQIAGLEPFLAKNWQARHSPKSGNPIYEHPTALVLYREDYRFLLENVIPRRGEGKAEYDMVIASQPYRARAPLEFKAQKVVTPLVRALGKGGRLLGIHSHGNDPGLEIVQQVWPRENPFTQTRHDLMRATKVDLGRDARRYNFNAYADARAIFRYDMHTLPSEISSSIGTSTLFAAWNAAIYVAQIDDLRLGDALRDSRYLDATREVLQKHGSLWFLDESYVVSRN